MRGRRVVAAALAVLALGACSSGDDDDAGGATSTTSATSADTSATTAPVEIERATSLLPFPNDTLTIADDTTATGRRIAFDPALMPSNADGVPIDPAQWDGLDGFSPGNAVLFQLDGLDLEASGAAPVTDIASSLDDDAPVVLLDADAGERLAYWVEQDAAAADAGETPITFVRPAQLLPEGHRIVVGLRDLVDDTGAPIAPVDAASTARVAPDLADAGVDPDDLVLAWDFTVASAESLSSRLLAMRDDAFAALGDAAPAFHVDTVEPSDRDGLRTEITGTFEVPLYLDGGGVAGSSLVVDADDRPQVQGTYTANFDCVIPDSASADDPTGVGVYGHGLLGAADQVPGGAGRVAAAANITFCGTNLIGMAEDDVPNAVAIIGDFSTFHTLPDRLLQGHLNTLFLGRLLTRPDGLASDPAFQDGGRPMLTDDLVYYGISQGGIMGAATSAVAQDWTRVVLDVAAVDYGLLLDRSVDFDSFRAVMDPAYPSPADRAVILQLVQLLWDRGEPTGYAEHLASDPYDGTPAKQVLIHVAFGDHQVANVASEVEARTLGATVHRPVVAAGRSHAVEPFALVPSTEYPSDGPAVVVWDSGSPTPPDENLPPRDGDDPHDNPRKTPAAIQQIATFLTTGQIVDTCDGAPCVAVGEDD